jgi:hypothetical protein
VKTRAAAPASRRTAVPGLAAFRSDNPPPSHAAVPRPHPTSMAEQKQTYDPATIEPKWQQFWLEHKVFRRQEPRRPRLRPRQPKFYALDMFPYPSAAGLHVGHPEGYTATDIVSRWKRAKGCNVLHPMGWDAFGLPAEQYAIQTNTHPGHDHGAEHRRRSAAAAAPRLLVRLGPRDQHRRPEVLPLDAVDLEAAARARARLRVECAGVVVRGARHRAGQRRGHQRQERAWRPPVRTAAAAAVGAEDHRVRRAPAADLDGSTGASR